ncbi:MAG: phosphate/phosphite/phosphonate ABC transporter substrate-binding protein [Sedimenticola sp.]
MRILCFLLIFGTTHLFAANPQSSIRFGLTAVVLTENLRFLDQWSGYLESKVGKQVEFVQRKSYREVMDLLESGAIDFAWIFGYPYVQQKSNQSLELLTVPIYRGEPRYHSYIIVHNTSPYQRFEDLEGKTFSFSDPDSNSGFLYPLAVISEKGRRPAAYFRQTFFTFNHAETVQAVAEQVADGGAVDSYIWEYMAIHRPELTKKTRIIKKSPGFGFPPIVSRIGVEPGTVRSMKNTLENMNDNAQGKSLLVQLKLDGFGAFPDSLFNEIRAMSFTVQATNPTQSESPVE